MYIRKNKVRCGQSLRTYLSIAHNVWTPARSASCRPQSRPVTLVSLGPSLNVDESLADDLLYAIESVYTHQLALNSRCPDSVRNAAAGLRPLHNFFKSIVARNSSLLVDYPDPHQRRLAIYHIVSARLVPIPVPASQPTPQPEHFVPQHFNERAHMHSVQPYPAAYVAAPTWPNHSTAVPSRHMEPQWPTSYAPLATPQGSPYSPPYHQGYRS